MTTRCQLRCPICPAGAGGGGYPGMGIDLEPALYVKALEEGRARGLRSVRLGVTGEPLLADSIHLWAEEASARGILDLSLITNGQLLEPAVSRRLMRAGLTRLMISVDAGSEEGYRRARPGGDFRRLEENIRAFLAERRAFGTGLPVLRLSFVERAGSEGERKLFREKFAALADYLSFQECAPIIRRGSLAGSGALAEARPASPEGPGSGGPSGTSASSGSSGRGGPDSPLASGIASPLASGIASAFASGVASVLAVLGAAAPSSGRIAQRLSAAGSPAPAGLQGSSPGGASGASAGLTFCPEPFTRICLYADGSLFPCCSDYGRLHPAGSLRDGTVAEAWRSLGAGLAREPGAPRHPACRLCRGCLDAAGAGTEDAKPRAAGEVPAGSSLRGSSPKRPPAVPGKGEKTAARRGGPEDRGGHDVPNAHEPQGAREPRHAHEPQGARAGQDDRAAQDACGGRRPPAAPEAPSPGPPPAAALPLTGLFADPAP
ncbi:MAG: radical SAM protein [Deltaproteobacteria bacterium]|nr:radical SAM protein [Deltaproteobacteria bacterium]